MNTIQHHDNWPDTFKDPEFWFVPEFMTAAAWGVAPPSCSRRANGGVPAGNQSCPQSPFPPTGLPPETAPEGASVPSGALVLRKLG